MNHKTKASIEIGNLTVSVEIPKEDLTISEIMDQVIEPLLWGAGYSQSVIDNWKTADE